MLQSRAEVPAESNGVQAAFKKHSSDICFLLKQTVASQPSFLERFI